MSLLSEYEAALKGNKNVTPVDSAAIEAGRAIAKAIDDILADDQATATEKTKALYLTPHLISILKELLATPLARKQVGMAVAEGKEVSRLKQMQEQAERATKGD